MSLWDFFGSGWDDPRSGQILGLAQGLLSAPGGRGLAAGIEGMQRARDYDTRRQVQQAQMAGMGLANERSQLELTGMRDAITRSKNIRNQLAALDAPQLPGPSAGTNTPPAIGGMTAPSYGAQGGQTPLIGQAGPQAPARANLTRDMTNRLVQQAQVYARNGDFETANKLYENAAKWLPEVHKMEVGMQDGQAVNVVTYKDGSQQVSPFAPAPKTHYLDAGGSVLPIDEYTGQQRGAAFPKSMTPGERASNAVAMGNLQVSRDRLALDRDQPQYMQTEQGIVALPKRPGAGAITAQTVAGPNGEPLTAPLKQIPSSANTAIQTNLQNLNRARTALSLIRGDNVGTSAGDQNATGWKGFLPGTVLNRMDPAGVDTRAAIADLGSLVIHDRSGAAVTAAEFPRLAPFIPSPTDDRATAEKKLQRFVQVYEQEVGGMREMYSRDQGYRPSPALERGSAPQPSAVGAVPLPPSPTAKSLQRGQAYQLPNGETAVWDGFKFKGQR
ncbi:MAG: hypothetical protein DI587_22240 [Variovorax paradoxus]|nr:MAG: hypothetical protein DI583_22240 [Variovorax paradoxus]PZQ06393.1 MAG: hypothetical protein DI587_22240 [Variovorax paradoxus]